MDLIPDEAPFSLDFYRQLVRNGNEAPNALEPVRVLNANPSIYLQRAGLTDTTVAAFEQAARGVVPALTGGRLSVTTFASGAEARPPTAGWIVAELVTDDGAPCGRSEVGSAAGHVWLNTIERCQRNGAIVGSPNLFAHELGHALGFWHVADPSALMNAVATRTLPTDQERYHAAIAYHRPRGNRDIDDDAAGGNFSAQRVIAVD